MKKLAKLLLIILVIGLTYFRINLDLKDKRLKQEILKTLEFYKNREISNFDDFYLFNRILKKTRDIFKRDKKLIKDLDSIEKNVKKILDRKKIDNNPLNRLYDKNYKLDDFKIKRLLSSKDHKMVEKLKVNYDNSFYYINDKYKKYQKDPWDELILKALYSDVIPYDSEDFYLLSSLINIKRKYNETHVLLTLVILKELNVYKNQNIDIYIEKLCMTLLDDIIKTKEFSDEYAEKIVFLYWAGHGNLIKQDYIDIILKNRNRDFGWSDKKGEKSAFHETGLSTLAIIYYNENRIKQNFFVF